MPDLQKLNTDKERIISTLRYKGPSFPARISKEVKISPLFVSAILAELVSEKRLKMSNMKVGSSPIYHLPGQEKELENFANFLNRREKDAFDLLKEKNILDDERQEPAIRVALRAIKDFAIPINVRISGQTKLYWKHSSVTDETARTIIENTVIKNTPQREEKPEEKIEQTKEEFKEERVDRNTEIKSSIQNNPNTEQTPAEKPIENKSPEPKPTTENLPKEETLPKQAIQEIPSKISKIEPSILENPPAHKSTNQKAKPKAEHKFPLKIKDYLTANEIEVLEEFLNKKREFSSRIRIDTQFGKQEYLLLAKEKKKITEQDLLIAIQRAQTEKMPALIMSEGELDKNAKEYLKTWRNLIKFERINL